MLSNKIKEYLSFDLVVLGYVNGHANDFSLLKEILIAPYSPLTAMRF